MRKIFICVCILVSAVVVSGCAKMGFDKGAIRENMYSEQVVTDDDIKRVLDLKPQIRFPFRLGVYFVEPSYGWYGFEEWEKDEKNLIWLDQLKTEGIVSEVIPVIPLTAEQNSNREGFLKAVRLAAARHKTDAVLIIGHNYGVDRYNNYSAFLYLTIIGGYLVPGTHSDSLVIMNGALWDVRNEYLYLTAETEGYAQKTGPAFILEDDESVRSAKQKAFREFKKEILRRMRNIKG